MTVTQLSISPLRYRCRDSELTGIVVRPAEPGPPRPAILIVHDAWGIGENVRMRANMLAELGYVALVADIYGGEAKPKVVADAQAQVDKFKADPELLRERALAGLETLGGLEGVDGARLGAIGYCFGGMTVLELARAGADCAATVSFHGLLTTSKPATPGSIRAKLLVCTGAEDPMVPMEHVAAFQEEIRVAEADCQTIIYSGAKHSFANPYASNNPGIAHHPDADRRSWAAMLALFDEAFGPA
jgi:dienelactone hydrolase